MMSGEYCVDCTNGEAWLFDEATVSELGFGDISGDCELSTD